MKKMSSLLSSLGFATLLAWPLETRGAEDDPAGPLAVPPPTRAYTLVLNESFGSARKGGTVSRVGDGDQEDDLLARWQFGQTGWLGSDGSNLIFRPNHLFIALTWSAHPVPPGFDNSGSPGGWGGAIQLTARTARRLAIIPAEGHSTWIEIRAKLPCSPEAWPAFWLYCNANNYRDGQEGGNQKSEVDILETHYTFYKDRIFRPDSFVSTTHTAPDALTVEQAWINPGPARLSDDFHIYACELTTESGKLSWKIFFDGKEQFASEKEFVWKSATATLILAGSAPAQDAKKPSSPDDGMGIDFVRIWKDG